MKYDLQSQMREMFLNREQHNAELFKLNETLEESIQDLLFRTVARPRVVLKTPNTCEDK
jgi:hypothetical protein